MNDLDNYINATPSNEAECEVCGDWIYKWKLFTPQGQRLSTLCCEGCYNELKQAEQDEIAAAFAYENES